MSPKLGGLFEQLGSAVRNQNSLPSRLAEIAILVVGADWKSQFEWFAHERLALNAGLSLTSIGHIKVNSSPEEIQSFLEEDELAVYTFCRELTRDKRVSDATFARVRSLLSEQQVTDLCFTMGTYHAVSLTLNVFKVPIPEGEPNPFEESPKDSEIQMLRA